METQAIGMTRAEASQLYRDYKKHVHYSEPIDQEIQRAYQLLSQGRLVIRALQSIVVAGLNEQGLPKLALCRATATSCECRINRDGSARMHDAAVAPRLRRPNWDVMQSASVFTFPAGSFKAAKDQWRAQALVPTPPLYMRPKRGLANYHVLWEAEWTRIVPRDPYLLRRIGKSDMWLVAAMWTLTEVERAALSARLNA